ncbi:MAG: hypothetical protein C0592_11680 [Marinilabiliales bacterium]|nr:MAG: hypothetical protein C0592_11680 [Marinilabiliales bacterium]
MKKIFAINGSPRANSNSGLLLDSFLNGATKSHAGITQYRTNELNIKNCTGCLRCNLIKRCSLRDDDWEKISHEMQASDVIVFASPVYFHHFPAGVKTIIDRFRSFINVQITEESIIHTPWHEWKKDFVLLLSMGSSDPVDAKPIIELFEFMIEVLGPESRLHVIAGTRLAVSRQITMTREELEVLYPKLQIPVELAEKDAAVNKQILTTANELGAQLAEL